MKSYGILIYIFQISQPILLYRFYAAGGATATFQYVLHNDIPVVSSASVTIVKSNLDKGTDTTSCTQDYARSLDDDGVQDCDAGHILANRLGGSGNQPINIFPQVSPPLLHPYEYLTVLLIRCDSLFLSPILGFECEPWRLRPVRGFHILLHHV